MILSGAAREDLPEKVRSEADIGGGEQSGCSPGGGALPAQAVATPGPEVGVCWVWRVLERTGGRWLRAAGAGLVCRAWRLGGPVENSMPQLTCPKGPLAVAGRADCRAEGSSRRPERGLNQGGT